MSPFEGSDAGHGGPADPRHMFRTRESWSRNPGMGPQTSRRMMSLNIEELKLKTLLSFPAFPQIALVRRAKIISPCGMDTGAFWQVKAR